MGRSLLALLAIAVGGCKSEINPAYCAAHMGDSRCPDGGTVATDGMINFDSFVSPEAGAQTCFGPQGTPYEICLDSLPTNAVTISNKTQINTDSTGGLCLPSQPADWTANNQPAACFIVGTDITIHDGTGGTAGPSHAFGGRPLVLLATGTITIDGGFDVSSKRGQTGGAGHDSALCAAFGGAPGASAGHGAGGGAGGSFMFAGGNGGTGNGTTIAAGIAATADTAHPAILRGGCLGQAGGNGDGNGAAGAGGSGGGALYVVSGKTITMTANAILAASGAGGASANVRRVGGSGGGSGGMIVLYGGTGFSIQSTAARLIADGGGGSSGGNSQFGGTQGNDGSSTTNTVATGGNFGGGSGGNGYNDPTAATAGGSNTGDNGGGGGGGGGGYIQVNQAIALTATPPITVP